MKTKRKISNLARRVMLFDRWVYISSLSFYGNSFGLNIQLAKLATLNSRVFTSIKGRHNVATGGGIDYNSNILRPM